MALAEVVMHSPGRLVTRLCVGRRPYLACFLLVCASLIACEAYLVFFRSTVAARTEGEQPFLIDTFANGATVTHAFLMSGDVLDGLSVRLIAEGPAALHVACRLLRLYDADADAESNPNLYSDIYRWVETWTISPGDHWRRIKFPPVVASNNQWYAFEIQAIDVAPAFASPESHHRRPALSVLASQDNPYRGGKLWINRVRQPGSLFIRVHGGTLYQQVQVAEARRPGIVGNRTVQALLALVFHSVVLVFAYGLLFPSKPVPSEHAPSSDQTRESSVGGWEEWLSRDPERAFWLSRDAPNVAYGLTRSATFSMTVTSRESRRLCLFFVAWLLLTNAYFTPTASWNPMSHWALTSSIVERGSLSIDPIADVTGDRAYREGHWYADKAPLPSMVGVVGYSVMRAMQAFAGDHGPGLVAHATGPIPATRVDLDTEARHLLHAASISASALPGALAGALLFLLLERRFPRNIALAAIALLLLGTPWFPYATSFYGHVPAGFFLLAALFVYDTNRMSAPKWSLIGASLVAAVSCEYIVAVAAAIIAGFVVRRSRQDGRASEAALFLVVGALPFAVAIGAYETMCFGAPWRTGYSFLSNPLFVEGHSHGLMGIGAPSPSAILGLAFGRSRGLFYLAPIALVGVCGLVQYLRRSDDETARVFAVCALAMLCANAGYYMWWGGAATGPRHLVPVLPALAWGVASALSNPKLRRLVLAIAIVSVANMTAFVAAGIEAPENQEALFGYAWSNVVNGHVAELPSASNLGIQIGLPGAASLGPLVVLWLAGAAYLMRRRPAVNDAARAGLVTRGPSLYETRRTAEFQERRAWRRVRPWLFAFALYVALAVIQTWPLTERLTSVLPSDLGDPVLNAWIVWWNAHAVPLTARWWNGPMFWPSSGALAFSETLLGLTPITSPIQWLGGSAITAYNVAFLLTFPLSALAAHALVFKVSGRHDAALIGGLIYGFHPFRVAHFPHIQVMSSYWMPVALLGLHRYVTKENAVWLWVSAFAWLMQALSNGYYLMFFPVLVAVWLVWFALSRARIRTVLAIIGAWAVASIPLVPLLWTYRRIHSAYGFHSRVGEINRFGADVVSLLDASPLLKFWHLESFHQAEGELFPGLTATLLVLVAIGVWLWSAPVERTRRACLVLLLMAVVVIGIALSAELAGPSTFAIGKVTLLSVPVVSRLLGIGVVLFVIALAFEPRFAGAWHRRSPLMFYILATALMYLLCFGPRLHFLGQTFMYRAPYEWLMSLPGYDTIRAPERFAMLAALCLAVSAALAFARLTARGGHLTRWALGSIVAAGVLVDGWIREMPLPMLPPPLHVLESLPPGTSVMELPLGDIGHDVLAIYRGMYHNRPVVNGYSGFFPKGYDALNRGLDAHDPHVFDAIAGWGPVAVAVDPREDPGGLWTRQLAARPGTVLLGEEAGRKVFSLTAATLPPDFDHVGRLPIDSASANVGNDRIGLALDRNTFTRWDSGPQSGNEVVTIDLGSQRTVEGLSMTIQDHLTDSPRLLVIESSADGREWTTHWRGATDVVALVGVLRHPVDAPLTFALPGVSARLLRLRQLGQDSAFHWSIYELTVFGR